MSMYVCVKMCLAFPICVNVYLSVCVHFDKNFVFSFSLSRLLNSVIRFFLLCFSQDLVSGITFHFSLALLAFSLALLAFSLALLAFTHDI